MTADATERISAIDECPALVFAGFYLDAFILNLLRLFYAERPLDRFPGARHLYYVPDIRSGGATDDPDSMVIDMWSQWNPSRTGSAPGIFVRRGKMGSTRIGIADKHQSPTPTHNNSVTTHTRVWTGSVTVWCLSRVERECSLLALQTADYLQGFAQEIATQIKVQRLEVRQISDVKPLREQPTFLASAVLIEYGFFLTWGTYPIAPRLNSVTLRST
jgi:hypothetical protein